MVEMLLQDNRFDPAYAQNWYIQTASDSGHLRIVKLLMQDPRVNPADDSNLAIIFAAAKGHNEIVKQLLRSPTVNPTDRKNQAIGLALKKRHYETVKLLLHDGRLDPFVSNIVRRILQLGLPDLNLALMLNDTVNPFAQAFRYFIWINAQMQFVLPDIVTYMCQLVLQIIWTGLIKN